MDNIIAKIIGFFFGILTVIGFLLFSLFGYALILAFPVMWLWDYVMPSLLRVSEITYLQAFGLYVLCGMLFKNSAATKKEVKVEEKK